MILPISALQAVKKRLRVNEGVKPKLYKDDRGFLTGGVGHNFDARDIPMPIIESLLQYDIEQTENELVAVWPFYRKLSSQRQVAVIDMAFTMGAAEFTNFTKMINAIEAGNYSVAALEMMDSDWARKNPRRAKDDAKIMETNSL